LRAAQLVDSLPTATQLAQLNQAAALADG